MYIQFYTRMTDKNNNKAKTQVLEIAIAVAVSISKMHLQSTILNGSFQFLLHGCRKSKKLKIYIHITSVGSQCVPDVN